MSEEKEKKQEEDAFIIKKENLLVSLSLVGSAVSIIAIIISATWFAGVIDKRITLLEKGSKITQKYIFHTKKSEKESQERFQASVQMHLERMQSQLDKYIDSPCEKK
jgi:hypothetical protein